MSRFRTYSEFESAVGQLIGDNNLDNQLGTWLNIAFNRKYREAIKAAQWPDVCLWEQRNPDGNGMVAYNAGTDPVTGLAVNDLEYIWGIYNNSPYQNLSLQPVKYILNNNGATIVAPSTQMLSNGYYPAVSPIGPFWIQCIEAIPQFTGSNYSAITGYHYNDVVYDTTTGDYWQNILVNAGIPLSNSTWWTSATIDNYSAGTTYASGAIVWDLANAGGYYKSNANSNVGNALTNPQYWTPISVTAWANQLNYSLNNVVYNPSGPTFYRSRTDNNSNNSLANTTHWTSITVAAYSTSQQYVVNDVVYVPGSGTFFKCIAANTNQLLSNTNYWQQIAVNAYTQGKTYATSDVVYDRSTASFYTCALDTVTQPLSVSSYWKRLRIPSVIFNYMVHAVYAEYLLMAKQNDKHKEETKFAADYLLTEKQNLQIAQNQRPVMQVMTHLNQHYI